MNEDVFNSSIRKFLKKLGLTAQREIEKAVRQALAEGKLKGNETFPAEATVTLGGVGLSLEIKGEMSSNSLPPRLLRSGQKASRVIAANQAGHHDIVECDWCWSSEETVTMLACLPSGSQHIMRYGLITVAPETIRCGTCLSLATVSYLEFSASAMWLSTGWRTCFA